MFVIVLSRIHDWEGWWFVCICLSILSTLLVDVKIIAKQNAIICFF